MNWKCELVMDLAPLYYDGVASRVSKRLVKKHLRECPQCRTYYKKYHPVDKVPTEVPNWDVGENYAMLARKVRKRRLVLWGGFLSYLSTTIVALVFWYARDKKDEKNLRQKMPKIRGFPSTLFFAQKKLRNLCNFFRNLGY